MINRVQQLRTDIGPLVSASQNIMGLEIVVIITFSFALAHGYMWSMDQRKKAMQAKIFHDGWRKTQSGLFGTFELASAKPLTFVGWWLLLHQTKTALTGQPRGHRNQNFIVVGDHRMECRLFGGMML